MVERSGCSHAVTSGAARILVCGLGPGAYGDVTAATAETLHSGRRVFLRTERHPTASLAAGAQTFDEIYDRGADLPSVYRSIADALVQAAEQLGEVVYAVPGSPLVLERSVRHLLDRAADSAGDLEVDVLPAVSFLDAAWARLAIDPVEASVRLIDGHTFSRDAAGERGPLLVAHAHAPWVLSDIKLAIDAGPEQRVIVLQALGTPEESIVEIGWPDLDRAIEPDHLTSLFLPEVHAPVAMELQRSVELMRRLRVDCPWDQVQTHASLRSHLLEETYEVLEALDHMAATEASGAEPDGDDYALLEAELGDLWFQVLFHAELASEAGQFTVADVARTLHDKLVDRHPHVFGGEPTPETADLVVAWEARKRDEKGRASAMDGLPPGLPALSLADKVLRKAERSGRAADPAWVSGALSAGVSAGASELEVGLYLLAVVEQVRGLGGEPESALRTAVRHGTERFRQAESSRDRWVLG